MKLLVASILATLSLTAHADIYKCPQPNGTIALTNQVDKAKGCEKMDLPKQPRSTTVTVTNSKGDAKTIIETSNTNYDKAVADRQRIIQEEINLENQRLLAVYDQYRPFPPEAKRTPEQQKAYEALQEKEKVHKTNIRALKKELDKR